MRPQRIVIHCKDERRLHELRFQLAAAQELCEVVVVDLTANSHTGALLASVLKAGVRVCSLTLVRTEFRDRDCVSAFFKAMEAIWMEPTLREVVFEACSLKTSSQLAFCVALDTHILENVEVLGMVAMPDCFNWTPTLESMCALQQLDLSYSDLPLSSFLNVFFRVPNMELQSLALNGHTLSAPCIRAILESPWPESVQHLYLSDCRLGGAHVPLLLYLFGKVQTISLSNNPNLLGAPLAAICEANPLTVRSLSLGGLGLSKSDVVSVLSLIDGKSVTALDLSRTHLSKKAFDMLLRGISAEGSSLLKLDLGYNMLHSLANFHELFACLQHPSHLTHLSLAGCGLTRIDVQVLADFLATDPPLEFLNVSDNALSSAVLLLARALKFNATLRAIEIMDRSITRETWCDFLAETKQCYGLTVQAIPDAGVIFNAVPSNVLVVSPTSVAQEAASLLPFNRVHFVDLTAETPWSFQHSSVDGPRYLYELSLQRCEGCAWTLPPLRPLSSLTALYLQACHMRDTDLAAVCGHAHLFPALRSLFVDSNKLTAITPRIGELKLLERISCRDNLLDELPVQMTQLNALVWLDMRFNPLSTLPFAPVMSSRTTIDVLFAYLRETASSHVVPNPLVRLCLFADDPALVTSFLAALKAGQMGEAEAAYVMKRGLTGSDKKKSSSAIGGQSAVNVDASRRSLNAVFRESSHRGSMPNINPYVKTSGAALVESLLQQKTLDFGEGVLAPQLGVTLVIWYGDALMQACPPQLLENCINIILFDGSPSRSESAMSKDIMNIKKVVGGGANSFGSHNQRAKKRFFAVGIVSKEESLTRAKETALQERLRKLTGARAYFFTSTLSATLQDCAKEALKGKMLGAPVPSSWVALAKKVESNLNPILTVQSFSLIAQGYSVSEISSVLRYLAERGLLWWFEDHKELRDWVFLNPARVYALCVHLTAQLREPVVSLASVETHWNGVVTPEAQPAFWRLLHVLNFLLEIPDFKSIVPDALPTGDTVPEPSVSSAIRLQETGRIYSYAFVQDVFFPRVQAKLHFWPHVNVESVWKGGIRLSSVRNAVVERAVLTWDSDTFELSVRVSAHLFSHGRKGSAPSSKPVQAEGHLLRVVVETVDAATRSCFCSDISIRIPCTHCLADEAARADPYYFTYEEVVNALTTDSRFVLCHQLKNRRVLISTLAPDIALADMGARRKTIAKTDIELGEELGRGGYARVCKGLYKGEVVAVKQIHSCTSPDEFAEFQREVWIMGGQNSPYLVKLHGVCLEPPMLVMEYLSEGTLYGFLEHKRAKQESMPFLLRTRIALDVARGMLVLSSSVPPLIHGDLKSPNVLLASTSYDAPCVAKVADFGLTHHMSGLESTGRDVHNPDWLAPEVILNLPYTTAADVFSYAIILWELAAMRHPFSEYDDRFQGFPLEMKEKAIALDNLRPTPPADLEEWYRALMEQAWQREPEKRPSFETIVALLRAQFPLDVSEPVEPAHARALRSATVTPEVGRTRPIGPSAVRQARVSLSQSQNLTTSSESAKDAIDTKAVCLMRRIVCDSLPTAVATTPESDWIFCGLESGAVLVASQRVGSILTQTEPLKHGSVSDVVVVSKKFVFFSFQDGAILSYSQNLVRMEYSYAHPSGAACLWMRATHLVNSPLVAAFADEVVILFSSSLSPLRTLQAPHLSAGIVEQIDGDIVMFLGFSKGNVNVYTVPDFSSRGKLQVSSKALSALAFDAKHATLWVGDTGGMLSPCKMVDAGQLSLLPSRQAHHSKIISFVLFPRVARLASRSIDGHLCWWTLTDMDLELETTEFAFASTLPSFDAGGTGVYGVCDPTTVSLGVYSISLTSETAMLTQSQAGLPPHMRRTQERRFSKMDMKALMSGADQRMALYVSVQQFRQTVDAEARRQMALRIKDEYFGEVGPHSVSGVSFDLKRTVRAKLVALSQDPSAPCPPDFLDNVAEYVIETQRGSLVDLTKTVFLDLCAKGLELRAMSYDETIVMSFLNMCTNEDAAAWDSLTVSAKWKPRDGKKPVRVKGNAWVFKNASDKDATIKARAIINSSAATIVEAVSRVDCRLQWENGLESLEMVEKFSEDFSVWHYVWQIAKLVRKRDAVLGKLLVTRGDVQMVISRSVPFGSIPSPANCERIEVDTSGYLIRPLDSHSCEVTYMIQVREIRHRVSPMVFKRLREKRCAQVFLLKHYVENFMGNQSPERSSTSLPTAQLGRARQATSAGGGTDSALSSRFSGSDTSAPGSEIAAFEEPIARTSTPPPIGLPRSPRGASQPPSPPPELSGSQDLKSPRSPRGLLAGLFSSKK